MTEKNEIRAEWDKFSYLFDRQEIPAKATLLLEGQISRTVYFVERGCIRSWFNNNGKDVTFQFFFEGEAVSSIESFRTNQPSMFNLETIEPSIIKSISKEDFEYILDNSATLKKEMEDLTLQRLLFYQKLFLSRIKDNPQKRYEELFKIRPEILLRIPQHYIASYLGITPVSLSRIRNRK